MRPGTVPEIDDQWFPIDAFFYHLHLVEKDGSFGFKSIIEKEIKENLIGLLIIYLNYKNPDIICLEYRLGKSVVCKTWGFREDVFKDQGQFAVCHQDVWYLKEDGDDFGRRAKFNADGALQWAAIVLSNNHKEIEVQIYP